jgi:hypothetical protein
LLKPRKTIMRRSSTTSTTLATTGASPHRDR